MRLALLLLSALPLAACATPQSLSLDRVAQDPWEARNRQIYAFNKKLDSRAVKPLTNVYRAAIPEAGRSAISNGFSNYGEPQNFFNYLFQGKIKRAFESLDRFLINSTLGLGGIADNATALGRPRQPTDWGQTFAQWGIKSGPYVMLPFFGPSSLRDGLGTPVDFVIDPSDFVRNAALSPSWFWRGGQVGIRVINVRSRVIDVGGDGLLAGSLDEYALLRSAWIQNRRAQLYYGNPPLPPQPADQDDEFSGEFSGEFSDEFTAPAADASASPPPQ